MISDLFSTAFVPRHHCGEWGGLYVTLYVFGAVLISTAYMAIPSILAWASRFERVAGYDPPALCRRDRNVVRSTYALFILLCGIGHFEGVLAFIAPTYHLYAVWHFVTGLVSWAAVFVTFRMRLRIVTGV